jgi:hypothetical protein
VPQSDKAMTTSVSNRARKQAGRTRARNEGVGLGHEEKARLALGALPTLALALIGFMQSLLIAVRHRVRRGMFVCLGLTTELLMG